MIRYVKVMGDVARCLPDNKADQATHHVECTEAQYALAKNDDYFNVVNGEPVHPTQAELDNRSALIQKANAVVDSKSVRDEQLESNVVEFNGIDIWASPAALPNLQTAYGKMLAGTSRRFYQDDTVYTLSKEDLGIVLATGIAQCEAIHDLHIERLEAL